MTTDATWISQLADDISNEGLDYFIESYTTMSGWQERHGDLPQDVRDAWAQLEHAMKHFRSVIKAHGVRCY